MTSQLDALVAAVDGDRLTATVTALAAAPFTGRRAGSAGGSAARAWLGAQLRDLGAQVTTEPFTVRAVPDAYAAPQVSWHDGGSVQHLTFGRQYAVHIASADAGRQRRGELAVAGAGGPAGRWLLVPRGMSLSEAYGHAEGAIGLLIVRDVDAHGWHYTVLAGPAPGPLPVLTLDPVTHAAVEVCATAGRGWFAADTPVRRIDVTAANLHARWQPAAAAGPQVLLTAHYDGVGDQPGLRQPGAADNAGGVAVVLEAARILAPALPAEAGAAVALLDAEELGAHGSALHAGQLRQAGATPVVINVDGAGHLAQAVAVEAGGPAHGLLALLDQAGRHTGVPLAAGPMASDNRRYAAAGLAAVGVGAGMAGYHSPADTPDRVETATLTAVCRLVVVTAWLAAGTPPADQTA